RTDARLQRRVSCFARGLVAAQGRGTAGHRCGRLVEARAGRRRARGDHRHESERRGRSDRAIHRAAASASRSSHHAPRLRAAGGGRSGVRRPGDDGQGAGRTSRDLMSKPANTPQPPYYAVIFTSLRTEVEEGYDATSDRMIELAAEQPGFLGVESARGEDGLGITVSYWENEEAIA